MLLRDFEALIKSEEVARQYVAVMCQKKRCRCCPKCGNSVLYAIRREMFRCRECKYEFTDQTGRWIGLLRIRSTEWLWIIKLFELEVSAFKASQQIGLSYPTMLKAYQIIRKCILHNSTGDYSFSKVQMVTPGSHRRGHDKRNGQREITAVNNVPVFGVFEKRGRVKIDIAATMTPTKIMNMNMKKMRHGSIIYTDKVGTHDGLIYCGYSHLQVHRRKQFSTEKKHFDALEGFWSYAKERLTKHHGISVRHFPYYLKEMEFRYNNRKEPLFEIIVGSICNVVS